MSRPGKTARLLLVLKAGSAPTNTLVRTLKAGDPSLSIFGCNDDRFVLKKSLADRNYLLPFAENHEFPRALARLVRAQRIDLVMPTSDADVRMLSAMRDRVARRVFLPRNAVIERCQDKYVLTTFLARRGVPVPHTRAVRSLKDIDALFRHMAPAGKLWCRIRRGTGSFGAMLVGSPRQARNWINCWHELRGVPVDWFTLSEYLPGRDFSVQSLWQQGKVLMAKAHERISYLVAGGGPSTVGSMAALAKVVHEPRVLDVGTRAVRALDPKASGTFFVDIKENADGQPCVTEINAGRFSTVSLTDDLAGHENMALAYVRVALGERVAVRKARTPDEDCYVLRDLDTLPAIVWSSDLYEGIEDARGY